ncbi:MAG: enoyl-CoA hydratase [Alphaproteobacteria bacterium]|nr:enoyl-CoA hydratase [Alphaproteobacteria bacterium]
MTDQILVDISDNVAWITFNRPEARNALSLEMRESLVGILHDLETDESVRCVVMRGAGKSFLAGGDVKTMYEATQTLTPEERFKRRVHSMHVTDYRIQALRRMPKPVLASVHGACAGGGMSLVGAADLAIAAEDTVFTFAFSKIGISPDGGSSYFLPRMMGMKKAFELAFMSDRFDAETAREIGLVNWVVPADQLEAETAKIAKRLASGATKAFGNTKALFNASLNNTIEQQLALETRSLAECMATEDHAEGVTAFVEKRPAVFKGR